MNDSFDNKLIAFFASRPPLLDGFRSLGEGVGESNESRTAFSKMAYAHHKHVSDGILTLA